jgi:hypothetical protein
VNQTDTYGFPYPECDPPYIADTADLPLDLYNLATAVDLEIAALNTEVADILDEPAGVIQMLLGPEALAAGATFTKLNTSLFSEDSTSDAPNSRLIARKAGLWVLTGTVASAAGVNATMSQVWITVNNAIVVASAIKPGPAGTEYLTTAYGMAVLAEGDVIRLAQTFTGGGSVSYTYGALGAALIREIP